jgi:hypothetical protein
VSSELSNKSGLSSSGKKSRAWEGENTQIEGMEGEDTQIEGMGEDAQIEGMGGRGCANRGHERERMRNWMRTEAGMDGPWRCHISGGSK